MLSARSRRILHTEFSAEFGGREIRNKYGDKEMKKGLVFQYDSAGKLCAVMSMACRINCILIFNVRRNRLRKTVNKCVRNE